MLVLTVCGIAFSQAQHYLVNHTYSFLLRLRSSSTCAVYHQKTMFVYVKYSREVGPLLRTCGLMKSRPWFLLLALAPRPEHVSSTAVGDLTSDALGLQKYT